MMNPTYQILEDASRHAHEFIEGLDSRPVGARADLAELRSRLERTLSDAGEDSRVVLEELVRDVEPGLVASAGPRYRLRDRRGTAGCRCRRLAPLSLGPERRRLRAAPALSVAEEVAGRWVREILGLPPECGIGFVTGCQMAHFTCLAAARHAVLRDSGWDVEADGLHGAPPVRVIASDQAHVTVGVACRMLGLGQERVQSVATDEQGRMRAAALEARWRRRRRRRSCAPRRATSTPAPLTRSRRSSPVAARTAPGVTSTAPSACGSRPARSGGGSSTATWAPTRGPRTGTSGSTSRTTAGSPPSRMRAHSARRWRPRRPTSPTTTPALRGVRLDAGVLPPGTRHTGVRRPAFPGPHRGGRDRRSLL